MMNKRYIEDQTPSTLVKGRLYISVQKDRRAEISRIHQVDKDMQSVHDVLKSHDNLLDIIY